jgi:hypothetical protein
MCHTWETLVGVRMAATEQPQNKNGGVGKQQWQSQQQGGQDVTVHRTPVGGMDQWRQGFS